MGHILKNDFNLKNDILAIDGVTLHDFDPSTRAPAMDGDHSLGVPPENRGVVLSERSESKDDAPNAPGLPGGLHFIDLGRVLEPSGTVPVTIKSLVFQF